jgi:acetyl-CoA carboxylase biotin carboxyl carrier protein
MDVEQILRLVEAVSGSGLTEFDYEEGQTKLHLEKKPPKVLQTMPPVSGFDAMAPISTIEPISAVEPEPKTEKKEAEGTFVTSPIVGVFYTAPGPEAKPFVQPGDRIEKGQVVGIVEAMKLMNEIQSDVSGTVAEICLQNGDNVEYGQPLIRVEK